MKKLAPTFAAFAVVLCAGLARAKPAPTCRDWAEQKSTAQSCVCDGEVRRGDDRAKSCEQRGAAEQRKQGPSSRVVGSAAAVEKLLSVPSFDNASAPAAPAAVLPDAPKPRKEPKFGFKSVTVQSGYISGADGSGMKNGSASLEFYRQKTRAGTLSGEVEIGRYRMGGIAINDSRDVGVVGQLPDGTPIDGTAITTGKSPAATYYPLAAFKYEPPVRLGRVHPYAVGEAGIASLSSVNAKVDTTIVGSAGGQPVFTQDMGTSYQPTGEKRNHPGGGFGGGAKIDLTRRASFNAEVIDAPTGYKVFKYGLTWDLSKKKDDAKK